ncbi:Scr1 family TA system antitoxin-like transcriptional regulator [Streptomyces atratus]|uniref:Scr1 family TA system antitoxin-like transcriptional regulator n=1 Tax=Streptomyces atratus TaxID=1893 RepID=UPI00224F037E|nr:Scr1 family TA system antitoxin-like transcriptional regulator [Streptomyces atratus]MCX5338611.1 DUF5753 domain-containing protein [Streptomyces atratus]
MPSQRPAARGHPSRRRVRSGWGLAGLARQPTSAAALYTEWRRRVRNCSTSRTMERRRPPPRSQVIRESGHRCLLLIEESALYFQLGDSDSMAAQLGHLLSAGALPAVSLGIIPLTTRERALWPQETFHVYDDTLVSVELLSAQVNITQPSEIALYLNAFEQLRGMAVYGAEARALIVKAIDALST